MNIFLKNIQFDLNMPHEKSIVVGTLYLIFKRLTSSFILKISTLILSTNIDDSQLQEIEGHQ